MKSHKHYQAAYDAHRGTSFSPDKRAEMYCKEFDSDIEKLKSLNVPAQKIAKYEQLWLKNMAAKSRCMSTMITGGSNFNVRRNNKMNSQQRNASEACLDYFNTLVAYAEKEKYYAENPEARPVMAGDSDAVERLQKKLDAHKKAHATMIAVNKVLRKKPVDMVKLTELMGSEEKAKKMLEPDFSGRTGFASYALNNNRANIKRIEGRIKQLTKAKAKDDAEITVNGVRVVQNNTDMRLELYFDGKPSADIRGVLKRNAFKWAPSKGAWQRQLTNNALYAFKHTVKPELESMEA